MKNLQKLGESSGEFEKGRAQDQKATWRALRFQNIDRAASYLEKIETEAVQNLLG